MNKQFLNALLSKPEPYLKVWVYVYCNLNEEQSFSMPTSYMLSMFKVSRSTLQRIVDFGCEWKASGKQVESKWNHNSLNINWHGEVSGKQVESKRKASGKEIEPIVEVKEQQVEIDEFVEFEQVVEEQPKKRRKKAESDKLYPQMIEAYDSFCQSKIGMGAKINAHQGKAMKSIIEYLTNQVRAKHGEDLVSEETIKEGVLIAWQYILNNWSKITGYYAEQIKLNQIDSNLPNLLMQLKNNSKNKRDEKYSDTYNEVRRINFDENE